MHANALLIGGYDEPLKGIIIREALMRIASETPYAKVLLVRDHYEPMPEMEDVNLSLDMEYLTGGCFCCSLKHDFESLLAAKGGEEGVRSFIVEVPLTADMDAVEGSMRAVLGPLAQATKTFVMGSSTYHVMAENFPVLFKQNMGVSDLLVLREEEGPVDSLEGGLGPEWQKAKNLGDVDPGLSNAGRIYLISRTGTTPWPF